MLVGIYFAYSKFSVSKDTEVVRTTVGDFIQGDIVIGAYIDGEYSKTIPGKNDGYIVDKIVCDNDASASWNNDSWGILVSNLTKRTKCNVYFIVKPVPVSEKIASAMSNNPDMFASDDPDYNLRYIGANPSNYIYFNCSDYSNQSDSTCEKWRIIGLFNNVSKSNGTKENLVKIIRDDSLGDYSWDSSDSSVNNGYGVNDWSAADVMKLLNPGYENESVGGSLYYNAKSGLCYSFWKNQNSSCDFTTNGLKNDETRNAIEEVVWSLGGTASYNSSSNGLASHWYGYERGIIVYSGRPMIWTGKIGLMYPSDYGYATEGSSNISRTTCLAQEIYNWGSSYNDCSINNYLYNSNNFQLTLTHYSGDASNVIFLYPDGILDFGNAYLNAALRPTLFLKSDITIKSGTGESSSPYQLNIN